MGCSWWSFATPSPYTDELTAVEDNPAVLLIPEYAVEWANGQTLLAIDHAGDYADFCMEEGSENGDWLDGHFLIGIFGNLYLRSLLQEELEDWGDEENSETEDLKERIAELNKDIPKFEDCFFSDDFPTDDKHMEDLRTYGIFTCFGASFDDLCHYAIKIVPADEAKGETYECVDGFSYCGQF